MDFNKLWASAKPYVTASVRHAVTGVAGALATYGAIQPSDEAKFEDITTGAAVWAIGYGLSAGSNWIKNRKTLKALNTAAPAVPATALPPSLK